MLEKMKKINKIDLLINILIASIAILYISLIFNDSLWGDEAYTMMMLKTSFVDIVKATAMDVHPPLYYFIAKIFTFVFGYSVAAVKIASITPVILTMLFVKSKAKKLFKENATLITVIFVLLIGLSPRAISMAVELRMYTWAMFFVTCSGIYAYELYKSGQNKKALILFILSGLAASYTHYYAAVTECIIYLFLIINLLISNKKNWKTCLIFSGATIIGYLPWLPIFIKQFTSVKQGWWIATFNSESILSIIKYLFNGDLVYFYMALVATVIVGLISTIKSKKKDHDIWFAVIAILSFVITIGMGCIVSILIEPIFVERYMYPAAGLFFLGLSIIICKSEYKNLIKDALIGLIVLNVILTYTIEYKKEYRTGTEEFKQIVAETIKQEEVSTDVMVLSWSILPYYLPNNTIVNEINENTRGYVITDKRIEELENIIKDAQIDYIYTGNVDNVHYFNIYYVR